MKRHWHMEAKRFHRETLKEYQLSPDEKLILEGACDQLSNYWRASDQLVAEGLTTTTEAGFVRAHPAAAIAKNSWASFLAACRLLQIGSPEDLKNRPGRPTGGHKGANQ